MGNRPSANKIATPGTTKKQLTIPNSVPIIHPPNIIEQDKLNPLQIPTIVYSIHSNTTSYPDLMNKVLQNQPIQIYLTGCGDSGKSTFAEQCLIQLHDPAKERQDYCSQEVRERKVPTLHHNIFWGFKDLYANSNSYGPLLPVNQTFIDSLPTDGDKQEKFRVTTQDIPSFQQLWMDPVIQQTWDNRHKLSDDLYPLDWWMGKLNDVADPVWVPSIEDVLRIRVRTSGIWPYSCRSPHGIELSIIDTGGQRSERRKWAPTWANTDIHITFVSLTHYAQNLLEDENCNRLREAIKMFDNLLTTPIMGEAIRQVIIFTKYDLFVEQIKKIPFSTYFPEYRGKNDDENAILRYIIEQFSSKLDTAIHSATIFVINTLDPHDVGHIIYHLGDMF